MRAARIRLLLAVFAGLLLPPATAHAGGQLYMLSPQAPHWPEASFPVPYNLNPDSALGCVQGPDPIGQFIDAAEAAFRTWEDVPTSRIVFARGPDANEELDLDPNDGVNLIAFHGWAVVQGVPIPLPPGVLGITNTVFDYETGLMQGAAITLNKDPFPDSANPDWSTSGMPGSLDVEAVILHEAGHLQGLCHSNVRNDEAGDLAGPPSHAAVMFPFIGFDVMDGRTLDADDIAWHGFVYPSSSYAASFGSVRGHVPYGSMRMACSPPAGADGAHVVARDLNDRVGGEPRMVVGSYSYREDGRLCPYLLPGLPPGEYGIWIEPMDGSPVAALQINTRIQFTLDTDFPEDWYSGEEESGAEPTPGDPASVAPVTVAPGGQVEGVDIVVEDLAPGWCMNAAESVPTGRRARAAVATLGVLLAPFLFLRLAGRIASRP
jgi:hypothetical protein